MKRFLPIQFPVGKYSELDPVQILNTLQGVEQGIVSCFPSSGLGHVSVELQQVGHAIVRLTDRLRRPIWALRLLTVAGVLGLIGFAAWIFVLAINHSHTLAAGQDGLMDTLQGIESLTNELIFISVSIFFFATFETRLKRRAALDSLHRLRSFAHVVDMHQLTKGPYNTFYCDDPDDPRFTTAKDLVRYLDFCTDLLAINSKLAALHAQYFQDSEVLKNVNEVEMLSHELSRKIWQKIMILDVMAQSGGAKEDVVKCDFG